MTTTLESKPRLPDFLSLLLVIAVGISLAKLMWMVITPLPKLTIAPENNSVSSISKKAEINYGKVIADQNIFGKIVIKKTPVKPKEKPIAVAKPVVPKVKLNAQLHGIVAYESRPGFAFISNNNGPQKVYGKGDNLQEGVIISSILPTKVVVDNNGVEEELLLPVKGKKTSKKSRQPQSFNSLPGNTPTRVAATNKASNNPPDLNQFRQEILTNPSKLSDIVRASPAIINGQFVGFRVRSGRKRKIFRQLNFRPNDIITEINGIVLDNPNKGLEVLSELENATSLSIKVKRGNEEVFIDHSF